ncbi:transcription repressor NadR [Bacillus sp. FJAT-45350]|uniref:transcription repressor NadR n=1 Tax=Bacillus sp. FJAT-45350 TaxID=2011014 RepID=UPI000BB750AC
MSVKKKILGEDRRKLILQWLQDNQKPITGNELAEKTNVSRQVIVQDISILKARNHDILATSQGYIYLQGNLEKEKHKKVIACKHHPEDTKKELMIIVDHGVTVKDVTIEHPVYGDLTGSLMLSNRRDVEQFIQKMEQTKASLLSELTEGVHLHTLEATTKEQLTEAVLALNKEGFLLQTTN